MILNNLQGSRKLSPEVEQFQKVVHFSDIDQVMEIKAEECNLSVMQYEEEKKSIDAEHERERKDDAKVDCNLMLKELWKKRKTD